MTRCIVIALCVALPAAAQDGGTSTAAPAPPAPKVEAKVFDEALEAYFAGKPKDAAPKLYAYVESTPSTDENHPWAQYFLARALIDLKLFHAGAYYLARIARERANPQVLPKALETLAKLTELPHDEKMIDQEIFGALDLGFLPEEVAGFASYQQGLTDLKVGNERWASSHFLKLDPESAEASRARYAVLVTKLKGARRDISKEMVSEFLELAKDEKLSAEARNESMLAVARLKYEQKDFDGALQAYSEVKLKPLDPGRATLYLEEAWTRYQLGQLHKAMGLLTTLDAPQFRDEFLPDKYLLRAFIYKDLCHYLPAKRAAKELTRRFADSLEALAQREDLKQDLRLRRAATSSGPTARAQAFLNSVQTEGETLGRYAGSFGDRLFSHLTKLYDLSHAEAVRVFEARLSESIRVEADKLVRAAEQVRLMEYEVGLKLYERIKRGSKLQAQVVEEPLTASQVGFKFDGEYWNDELRDFRFSLKSRCIEETAR